MMQFLAYLTDSLSVLRTLDMAFVIFRGRRVVIARNSPRLADASYTPVG